MGERILEGYGSWAATESLLLPQTLGRILSIEPESASPRRGRCYQSSEAFWADVFSERLVAERDVELSRFRLFEWFPRSPGRFHTRDAAWSRRMASRQILSVGQEVHDTYRAGADAPPDHASLFRGATSSDCAARLPIFTPQGKVAMLEGGIGCIRLQPAEARGLGLAWFMSATSSLSPDEGVPLLIPDSLYQEFIDQIRDRGFADVSIKGRARFIPREFTQLYSRDGIPRLYVEVTEISAEAQSSAFGLVSVAASFIGAVEGYQGVYAAYVTFDPGHSGAKAKATEWLQKEYVEGLYNGWMLTDFDQQAPAFSDTLFSLDDVLTSPDLVKTINRLREVHGQFDFRMIDKNTFNFNEIKEYRRVKIIANNNSGSQNFAFDHSSMTVSGASASDLQTLAAQLASLTNELRKEASSDERDEAVGHLIEAKRAAAAGDGQATHSALAKLRPIGLKIVDIGEKISVGVATAAIKSVLGF